MAMKRTSSVKGKKLGHREFMRCYLALHLLDVSQIDSKSLQEKYYGDLSDESFYNTFRRDRKELEKEGIYLTETKQGSKKIWSIDESKTLADTKKITELERRSAAILLRAAQKGMQTFQQNNLGAAIARIGQMNAEGIEQLEALAPDCKPEILSLINEALHRHLPISAKYKSLKDTRAKERILKPYGVFSIDRDIYVVGLRAREGAEESIRTFNLKRINSAKLLTKEPAYAIPKDFSVEDYRYLPFEIGDEPTQTMKVFVEAAQLADFKPLIGKRDSFSETQDGLIWQNYMRDTKAAVNWCIEADVIPIAPPSLVDAWTSCIKGALND